MSKSRQDFRLRRFTILISVVIASGVLLSCKSHNQSPSNRILATTIIASVPPFQTKEPDRYQATRSITFSKPGSESVETRTWIAKDGNARRDEYQTATNQRVVYLDLPTGHFLLLPNAKLYADVGSEGPGELEPHPDEDPHEISVDRLLSVDPIGARYEKIGSEVINGRNTTKYRVVVNNSGGESVSNGETLVWVDESLGMPIRSETVTAYDSRTTMELSGIVLQVDKNLFEIPDGYKKVAARELRGRLNALH